MGFVSKTKLAICAIAHWYILPILEVDVRLMHSDATFRSGIWIFIVESNDFDEEIKEDALDEEWR